METEKDENSYLEQQKLTIKQNYQKYNVLRFDQAELESDAEESIDEENMLALRIQQGMQMHGIRTREKTRTKLVALSSNSSSRKNSGFLGVLGMPAGIRSKRVSNFNIVC
jgi:hypothetical protein